MEEERILFVSKFSEPSIMAIQICQELGLGGVIQVISIDNPITRRLIENTKYFSLRHVPTIITNNMGTIKAYVGPTASSYMRELSQKLYNYQSESPQNTPIPPTKKPRKRRVLPPRRRRIKTPVPPKRRQRKPLSPPEDSEEEIEESEPEEEEEILEEEEYENGELSGSQYQSPKKDEKMVFPKIDIRSIISQAQAQRNGELKDIETTGTPY